jgi:predicted Zn-dependent peptidase
MSEKGLINSSFESEVFAGDGFFTLMFSGESQNPEELYKNLNATIAKAQQDGINEELFESLRKEQYGSIIRSFNNVNSVAETLINDYFANVGSFDSLSILRSLTYDETLRFFKENINVDNSAISVVRS